MELERLQQILSDEDTGKAIEKIKSVTVEDSDKLTEYSKQYDPLQHDVFDLNLRPKNKVVNDKGEVSDLDINRIAVPLQKMIVNRAAQFLAGNPIQLDAAVEENNKRQKDFVAALQKVWDDNKLDYKTKSIIKKTMSETACAEIWYADKVDTDFWKNYILANKLFTLRTRIIAKSLGDELFPLFDAMQNMIAFGRFYKIYDEEEKQIDVFDLYTDTLLYELRPVDGGWLRTSKPHGFKKIPVIYAKQDHAEWADVQPMITRLETLLSNHADTNDRVGAPAVVATGKITGMQNGNLGQVKVFEVQNGGDLKYLTLDSAPESIRLEIEQLWKLIHVCSDTPDTSPNDEKGLGQVSGVALEMRFLNAHLKAADKEEIYGEFLQRRINFLKSGLVMIDNSLSDMLPLAIKPRFEYFMPKNIVEKVDMLVTATAGGIMSKETAVRQNPLVQDPDAELKLLEGEAQQAAQNTPAKIDGEMNNPQ